MMESDDLIPGRLEAERALTAAEAEIFAQRGRLKVGLRLLSRGIEEAERHLAAGEPWALPLLARWRRTTHEYVARHHRPDRGAPGAEWPARKAR